MQITAMQLKQIAKVCDTLTEIEDEYIDNPHDATLINTDIAITDRKRGKRLGIIKMGTASSYVFEPA